MNLCEITEITWIRSEGKFMTKNWNWDIISEIAENYFWMWIFHEREFTNPLSNLSFLEVCLHLRPCTVCLFWLENPKNNSEKKLIFFFLSQKFPLFKTANYLLCWRYLSNLIKIQSPDQLNFLISLKGRISKIERTFFGRHFCTQSYFDIDKSFFKPSMNRIILKAWG